MDISCWTRQSISWWASQSVGQWMHHVSCVYCTMILLVVPLGFSTGTELLKTRAHSSHTDFPMVNLDPPDSERRRQRQMKVTDNKTFNVPSVYCTPVLVLDPSCSPQCAVITSIMLAFNISFQKLHQPCNLLVSGPAAEVGLLATVSLSNTDAAREDQTCIWCFTSSPTTEVTSFLRGPVDMVTLKRKMVLHGRQWCHHTLSATLYIFFMILGCSHWLQGQSAPQWCENRLMLKVQTEGTQLKSKDLYGVIKD